MPVRTEKMGIFLYEYTSLELDIPGPEKSAPGYDVLSIPAFPLY